MAFAWYWRKGRFKQIHEWYNHQGFDAIGNDDYCIKELRGESDADIQGIFQEKTDIGLCKIQINSIIQHSIVP